MNYLKVICFYCCSFILFVACGPTDERSAGSDERSVESAQSYPTYFREVLQAHGGLEQWKQMSTLQYRLHKDGNTETHTIDLKNRKDLIEASNYTIGNNGEQVWVSPNKAAFPGKSAKFYHNLYFYFLSIPFVLADSGVTYEQLENMELQGQQYEVIEAGFGAGVGDSPDDKFRLLINPQTKRLEWLLFTSTFFDRQASDKFNALKYEDYQEQQGLLFPRKLTGYAYENGQIGDVHYVNHFDQLQLKEEQPDQQLFEMPEQAEVAE
jgi:hypothetical protein